MHSCFCMRVCPSTSQLVRPSSEGLQRDGCGGGCEEGEETFGVTKFAARLSSKSHSLARNYRILHQCCLLLGRLKYTLSGLTAAFQEQYHHLWRLHPHWLLFWGSIFTLGISPKSVNLASSYSKDPGNWTPQPQCLRIAAVGATTHPPQTVTFSSNFSHVPTTHEQCVYSNSAWQDLSIDI